MALPFCPQPKPLPHILAKKARKQSREDQGKAFRDAVWERDRHRSRATGRWLERHGLTDWDLLGEVDHVINRSIAPERIYDVSNGILLSKAENRLKKTPCPRAPEFFMFSVEGPDDLKLPQTFTWRDIDGKILRQTMG